MAKVYTIRETYSPPFSGKCREKILTGTLEELTEWFSYSLEVGASHQNEQGCKKINRHPGTIKSLLTNVENAKNNSSIFGYSGYSYELV